MKTLLTCIVILISYELAIELWPDLRPVVGPESVED